MNRHLVVIGGGVIGLSIAWEALRRGMKVTLVERGPLAGQASWASAGILPYINPQTAIHPLEQLTAASHALHFSWYRDLVRESGIDYEFQVAGTIHFARTRTEKASLLGLESRCRDEAIPYSTLANAELRRELPTMCELIESGQVVHAVKLLLDAQLRSPRFLTALRIASRNRGANLIDRAGQVNFKHCNERVQSAQTENCGEIVGDEFCVASGAWSSDLLRPLGSPIEFIPIRGQIAFYQLASRPFLPVVYEGGNYIVPRADGGLLVGSTLEEAGFDPTTTPEAIDTLGRFANDVVPEVGGRAADRVWAGLRPATFDGFPFLGRVPPFQNLYLAAGHFRAGIHLAPITAQALSDLLCDRLFPIDLSPFRPSRAQEHVTRLFRDFGPARPI